MPWFARVLLIAVIVALVGAVLRYGLPPLDGWLMFAGALVFFLGVQSPIVIQVWRRNRLRDCLPDRAVR